VKRLKLRNALSTRIRIAVSSLCLCGLTLEIKRLLTFVDRLVVDMRKQTKRPTQRRQPTQNRAQETVSAILEAVIRLLKRGGLSAITTNHIAVAAGVSIGSVYQYFPNKQAIFLALHERHINHVDQVLRRRMSQSVGEPLEQLVSSLLDGMIEVHASDSELALLLDTEIPHRAGGAGDLSVRLHEAFRKALAPHAGVLGGTVKLHARAFLLGNMLDALGHAVVLRRPHALSLRSAKLETVNAVLASLKS
jgi:AcrR family transcriptional regulator